MVSLQFNVGWGYLDLFVAALLCSPSTRHPALLVAAMEFGAASFGQLNAKQDATSSITMMGVAMLGFLMGRN